MLLQVLHVHRGTKLLENRRTKDNVRSNRAVVRFRGAWEKGTMTLLECLGVSEGHHHALVRSLCESKEQMSFQERATEQQAGHIPLRMDVNI